MTFFDWPEPPKCDDDHDVTLAQSLQEQMILSENNLIRNYEDIQNLVRRTPWEMLDDSLKHLTYIVQKVDARPELVSYFNESLAQHIQSRGNGQVGILADDVREWWKAGFHFPGKEEIDPLRHDRAPGQAFGNAGDLSGDEKYGLSRVTISPGCSEASSDESGLATEELYGISPQGAGWPVLDKEGKLQ